MLSVALKEWSIVCDLLVEGKLALLLRKGGIHEAGGPGVFELEHPRFALFPSWAHQNLESIKPTFQGRSRGRIQTQEEPVEITIGAVAEAVEIYRVRDRGQIGGLDDLHCWTQPYIDMRFNYKPHRPLYLVLLRAYRLEQPRTIQNNQEYGGCRSWVPLRPGDEIDDLRATPVVDDAAFDRIRDRVRAAVSVSL